MTKTEERYPAAIGMYCDNDDCEIDIVRDYLVRASDDWPTRVAYARTQLRLDGWVCDARGDFCPEHAPIQFKERSDVGVVLAQPVDDGIRLTVRQR